MIGERSWRLVCASVIVKANIYKLCCLARQLTGIELGIMIGAQLVGI
jgi:hypothetical protein